MKKVIINLGKKNLGYYLKFIISFPFWIGSTSPTKKTWKEFTYGLISHRHEFDYDHIQYDDDDKAKKYGYYKCKHFGCNIITVCDKNGKLIR